MKNVQSLSIIAHRSNEKKNKIIFSTTVVVAEMAAWPIPGVRWTCMWWWRRWLPADVICVFYVRKIVIAGIGK